MERLDTLRERVKDAHLAYLFAQAQVKEIQEERAKWGNFPIPNDCGRYQRALECEAIALRHYREAVHELAEALRVTPNGISIGGF